MSRRKPPPTCDFCNEVAFVKRVWSDDGNLWTAEMRCRDHADIPFLERHALESTAMLHPVYAADLLRKMYDNVSDI